MAQFIHQRYRMCIYEAVLFCSTEPYLMYSKSEQNKTNKVDTHYVALVMIFTFPNRNRVISTPLLNTLLRLHIVPINVIISYDPIRNLILKLASLLDAFRGYPFPT